MIFHGQAQDNKIVLSDLFGTWSYENTVIGKDSDLTIYKRCEDGKKNKVYRFYSNGNFEIVYNHNLNRPRRPLRCGNEYINRNKPENSKGTYRFDQQQQHLILKNSESYVKEQWNLVWFGENSFGVIQPKYVVMSN